MNKILILLLFAIIFTSCSKSKNDLHFYNLKGKVWKTQETRYNASEKFGKYSAEKKERSGHYYYEFNDSGNLVDYRILDSKGKIISSRNFIYNNDNLRTETTTLKKGKVTIKKINLIENGKIVKEEVYDKEGKKIEVYNFTYSGSDLIGVSKQNIEGKKIESFENEFHDGFTIKQIIKDSLGETDYIQEFVRNDLNDMVSYIYSKPRDSIKVTYKYEYDDKNNWVKKYSFHRKGKIDDITVRNIVYFDDSIKNRTEGDFVGMWFEMGDNDWIEFQKNKKYDSGYNSRIKESGKWEVDFDTKLLTFRANDPDDSKKYIFNFEGDQMVLYSMDGEEKLRLKKR